MCFLRLQNDDMLLSAHCWGLRCLHIKSWKHADIKDWSEKYEKPITSELPSKVDCLRCWRCSHILRCWKELWKDILENQCWNPRWWSLEDLSYYYNWCLSADSLLIYFEEKAGCVITDCSAQCLQIMTYWLIEEELGTDYCTCCCADWPVNIHLSFNNVYVHVQMKLPDSPL